MRQAQVVSQAVYGNRRVYLEKAILPAYQVGVQIIADGHGNLMHLGDREGSVLFNGMKIVEEAPTEIIFGEPLHPYTQALMSAIPVPDPTMKRQRIILQGDVPSPLNPPTGCRFHTRCPVVMEQCKTIEPQMEQVEPGHRVACHLVE